MLLDPVPQGLLDHAQAASHCRLTLARLNKPCRLLLELKRVTSHFDFVVFATLFALEQLAKGYVLRGQGQWNHPILPLQPLPFTRDLD